MAAIFFTFDSHTFLPFMQRLCFWTKGVHRGSKAMTEVIEPGGHGKVASVLLFLQLENFSCQRFTDFLKILPVTPAT